MPSGSELINLCHSVSFTHRCTAVMAMKCYMRWHIFSHGHLLSHLSAPLLTPWPTFFLHTFFFAFGISLFFFHPSPSRSVISPLLFQTVILTLLISLLALNFLFIRSLLLCFVFQSRTGRPMCHLLTGSHFKWSNKVPTTFPLCFFSRSSIFSNYPPQFCVAAERFSACMWISMALHYIILRSV